MALEELIIINDDGERTVIWHPPLDKGTVKQISGMLRNEQVFVGTFTEDPYEPSLYIQQEGLHNTKTQLLLDTNVLTRVIELAKGREASKEHLIPAAVMAFASCARLLTMPAGGLYEEALSRQGRDSNLDLAFFRAGDGLDPQEWADVAVGDAARLKSRLVVESNTNYDFEKPIETFGFVYPHVLKIAALELGGGSCEQRFLDFLTWQFEHWLFSASANLLALRVFSANPPKKALKALRKGNRDDAFRGIRNAANDLAFANAYMHVYEQQAEDNELTVFCSRDTLLLDIVRDLQAAFQGSNLLLEGIETQFGSELLSKYKEFNVPLSSSRKRMYRKDEAYQLAIVGDLEKQIENFCA